MRTKEELVALIDEHMKGLGGLPLSAEWMAAGIRHVQRNVDLDIDWDDDGPHDYKDGNQPDRYAGTAMAALLNALPEIRAALAQ